MTLANLHARLHSLNIFRLTHSCSKHDWRQSHILNGYLVAGSRQGLHVYAVKSTVASPSTFSVNAQETCTMSQIC